ncbi:MAG: hypothetical protein JWM50_2199 [Microbacteriaceae bacterium]|jgi:hypothetical protein|nr:hypothetical protein [Microbacteriaceae bacterium]
MYVLVSFVMFAVIIGALVDIITSDEWQVKHLPKLVWVLLVIVLPLIGSILWFAVGRERTSPVDLGSLGDPRRAEAAPTDQSTPEDDLARVEREIEFHEKQARIARLEASLDARRKKT